MPMNNLNLPFEYISVQDAENAFSDHHHMLSFTDLCGFFLCQHGWVDVSLNEQTFHIQEGDVYFYMPSTFVCLLNHSTDVEGIAVKCKVDFILPLMEQMFSGGGVLAMRDYPCISLSDDQRRSLECLATMVRERLKQLSTASYDDSSTYILQRLVMSLAESLFHELIFDYACNQSIRPQIHDNKDRIFQAFLVSLFHNYKKEREVAFYAAEQCLSPRYFSSVIKEKSGHSALQWIVQMVISSARQILTTTNLSIKEIAMDFNFPSQSFFGKYFKQYVGVSPKEYRLQEKLAKS